MLITRKAEFSASHVCARPDWTPEQNQAVFGAAANPHGHGHNYSVEVTLEGEPDAQSGMIFDLKELKDIVQDRILEPFDHRHLNREVKPLDTVIPTVENVAIEIWKRLAPLFPAGGPAQLRNVRLYETEDLFVDYAGGGDPL
jgi:6-pyruvoyltetrahydropterin/6-carboxytetrahydropterin synthase